LKKKQANTTAYGIDAIKERRPEMKTDEEEVVEECPECGSKKFILDTDSTLRCKECKKLIIRRNKIEISER
jgi:Zn finger protein HypA/HybF involved in hydrogenase expression